MRNKIKIGALVILMMMLTIICPKNVHGFIGGKIVFKQDTINIYVGDKATVLDYTVEGEDSLSVKGSYLKYDKNMVLFEYVDDKFYITGLKEGTTTVYVTDNYTSSNKITVNVIKRDLKVNLNNKTVKIDTSKKKYADIYFEINDATEYENIGAKVNNEKIADCDVYKDGNYIVYVGYDKMKASITAYNSIGGKTKVTLYQISTGKELATINVEVVNPITSISIFNDDDFKKGLYVGDSKTLDVYVQPKETTEKVQFKSLTPKIASVSKKGVVKALKAGTAKIKVYSSKKSTTLQFKVKGPTIKKSEQVYVGGKCQVKLENAKIKDIKWKISNPKIATISVKKGVCTVKAKKKGTAKLTATYYGKKYVCTIKVIAPRCDFTVTMLEELNSYTTTVVTISIKNNSTKNMAVLPAAYYEVLGYPNFSRVADLNSGYTVIKPGQKKNLNFILTSKSWYDEDSKLTFQVSFNNKIYEVEAIAKNCCYKKSGNKITYGLRYEIIDKGRVYQTTTWRE